MWVALILGCANQNNQPLSQKASNSNSQVASQPAIKPVVDIPQLVSKSSAELDKVLGRPIRITKITNDPEMMPGEYRDYKIDNSIGALTEDGLWVRFHRGKADHFTVDLPHLTDTPEEALLMVGIDVKGAAAKIKAPLADRWTGNFNGIDFKDVAALKMDAGGKKYSSVQAEVAK
jgi:hypothetical protein